MSLSDCEKCWSTPCECGHGYQHFSIDRLESLRKVLKRVIKDKQKIDRSWEGPGNR